MVQIQNIVGTGSLNVEIDVATLSEDIEAEEVTYNPDNYHGLYVRLVNGGPLITLYRTGKYIVTGADSEEELYNTKNGFLSLLAETGVISEAADDSFNVNNIVCTDDLGYSVDLTQVVVALGLERTEYEPEQFPGVVYRPDGHPCVILLFGSGKMVITGAPTLKDAEEAYTHAREQIDSLLRS